jgi:hypothetical protein
MKNNSVPYIGLISIIYLLSGCAASQVALSKKNLDVQTKMSASLFLDPVDDDRQKTVYLQIKNTSDKSEFQIREDLSAALQEKGFKVVSKTNQAHYILQANVLQVGKSDPNAAESAMYKGYGADGALIGMGAAHVAGAESSQALVGAGLLGGIVSVAADSLVKDVYYSVITDIQIKEKLGKNQKSDNHSRHYNESGTSGATVTYYSEKSDWKTYQTRVLSSANKVNLELAQALPSLKKGLVQSISGIF